MSKVVNRTAHTASRLHSLAVSMSLFALPSLVDAQVIQQQALDTITVQGDWIGNPTAEDAKEYSGARTVIDRRQIEQSGALNLEDALRSSPSVQILDETGTGILPNIGLRGLNPLRSERLQMLVDGYPIAIGPYSNVGVSLFPLTMASVDTIDIVRGGAAVHYGPNNVGGVMNFITRPIPGKLEQTFQQRATIASETGHIFNDSYYRIGGFVNDDLALQLQANVQRGNGFRQHSNTQVNNFIFDAEYYLNARNDFDFSLQYYDVDADLPGALSPDAYEEDRYQSQRPYDAYKAKMWRGTFAWTYRPNENVEFKWRNFAHRADRTFYFGQNFSEGAGWSDPAYQSTDVADSPRKFDVWGTEPRLTVRHGIQTITVGARYVHEKVDFDVNRTKLATGRTSAIREWDLETNAIALYASDTFSLLNDTLKITPGIRYESVRMNFTDVLGRATSANKANEVLPGLTIGFDVSKDLFVFANAQKSLVPVQIAQATKKQAVANETAWNYELGARWQATDKVALSSTLFQIDYTDQIQYDKAGDRYVNLGETQHRGVELQTDLELTSNLDLRLGYTYLQTKQKSGPFAGNQLPNAPKHHFSAEFGYEYQNWHASVAAFYVGESFSDAANTVQETPSGSAGQLPDYTLVNVRIARDFKMGDGQVLSLGLVANNLFDADYYFRGADVSPIGRIPGPGRSIIAEANLTF
ncbi:MAG: TonB-dependent siderophore receptor [Pusillimonas sp.]|nr:TonB-dependent siderophore receptor [Pusillimonas sp.]